jgi:hypothetical protein
MRRSISARLAALAVAALAPACDLLRREAPIPTAEEAAAYYKGAAGLIGVEVSGNVVEVRIRQPESQLRRGGSLWARVGPYVYLFTPGTRDLFEAYGGVAAVRVITLAPGDVEVARATLKRDALSDILWRRSINLLGLALEEGTRRPSRLEDLVEWGERHTEYRYNPTYVPEHQR